MEESSSERNERTISETQPSTTPGRRTPEKLDTKSFTAVDRQYAVQSPNLPRRIHIIGLGSIGLLVAHSLRSIPSPPPITLILHRENLFRTWQDSERKISLQDEDRLTRRGGCDVEYVPQVIRQHGISVNRGSPDVYRVADGSGVQPHEAAGILSETQERTTIGQETEQDEARELSGSNDEPIHNLIVTTKTTATITALSSIRHRITNRTTICFLQNGMGVIDEVNKQLFPNEQTRPSYVQGVITHGANQPPEKRAVDPFYVVHAGHGTIALAIMPRKRVESSSPTAASPNDYPPAPEIPNEADEVGNQPQTALWASSARYMARTLTRCPVLCAAAFTPIELFQLQLEKLAVNCIINPLTVLLDNRNGNILYNFSLTRTMRLMLAEISLVIRSLPELKGIPNVPHRFSAEHLETLVIGVANKTSNNISSMLADVRAGRKTEIEYINGYIIQRGEELGIKCVVNYAIMQTVIGKCLMIQRETADSVPLARSENDS